MMVRLRWARGILLKYSARPSCEATPDALSVTRSVAPTEAGEQLIGRLRPALREVESVLDRIVESRAWPRGSRSSLGHADVRHDGARTQAGLHLPVGSRISSSTSPRRKRDARSWSPRASMPAFTSANRFSATWWPYGFRAITG